MQDECVGFVLIITTIQVVVVGASGQEKVESSKLCSSDDRKYFRYPKRVASVVDFPRTADAS